MKLTPCLALVSAVVLPAVFAHAAAFQNGGFELGTLPGATGWTLITTSGSGAVKTGINAYNAGPSEGSRYVQFGGSGSANGSYVYQTFDTLIGTTYQVAFDMGLYGATAGATNPSIQAILKVSVDNTDATNATFSDTTQSTFASTTTNNPTYADSLNKVFTFTASGASTTLTFLDQSIGGSASDTALDNVRISVVPESSTYGVIGAGALVAALAARRRRRTA